MRITLPVALLLLLAVAPAGGTAEAQTFPPQPPGSSLGVSQPGARHTPVVNPPHHVREHPAHHREGAAAPSAPRPAAPKVAKAPPKPQTPPPPAVATAPATAPPPPPNPAKGTVTGLDLPRWASLRSEDVNLRVGPGTTYQIQWVYHRRDLPVLIEREYEVWRQVEDQDGVKGWVHTATLTARRSFVIKDTEKMLRATAADDGAPVARLKPGVVGRIRACEANAAWCDVQVGDYRGFLRRSDFWGTFPNEAVN